MQLILNTPGAYLHQRDEMFEIKIDEIKKKISPKKVQSILITTGVYLSSNAIKLAVEHNIDILFLDKFGSPYGRVWHDRLGSTARIRQIQLQISQTEKGFDVGKNFILQKLNNQIVFLESLRKKRTRLSKELTKAIVTLGNSYEQCQQLAGTAEDLRGSIMGIEGSAAKVYWEVLSLLLPDRFRFKGRSRNPAKDEFNCLLNYAYGVLYGIIERASVIAGIDPYVGFIHTDHYAKISFVFDAIEAYRIYADEAVLKLFSQKKVKASMFSPHRDGITLNKEGKVALMTEYNEFLDVAISYRNRNIKRRDTIQFDLHRLANSWIKSITTESTADL